MKAVDNCGHITEDRNQRWMTVVDNHGRITEDRKQRWMKTMDNYGRVTEDRKQRWIKAGQVLERRGLPLFNLFISLQSIILKYASCR